MLQTDIAPTRKEKIMSSPKPPFIQTPSVTVANAPFEPLQQNQKTTEVAGESSSDSRQAAAAPRDPAVACPKMKKRFEVVPGVSWGSLPTELQKYAIFLYLIRCTKITQYCTKLMILGCGQT